MERIFIYLAVTVSQGEIEKVQQLLFKTIPFISPQSNANESNSVLNIPSILSILIVLTPESIPSNKLLFIIEFLSEVFAFQPEQDEIYEIKDILNEIVESESVSNEEAVAELQAFLVEETSHLTWGEQQIAEAGLDKELLLVAFTQSRIERISSLINPIPSQLPLLEEINSPRLSDWKDGLLMPFDHYTTKFGLLGSTTSFAKWKASNYLLIFDTILGDNINGVEKEQLCDIIRLVVLPVSSYVDDLSPFVEWFKNYGTNRIVSPNVIVDDMYDTYNRLIRVVFENDVITSKFERECGSLISIYLAICYICPSTSLRIFVSMKDTLNYFSQFKLLDGEIFDISETLALDNFPASYDIAGLKNFINSHATWDITQPTKHSINVLINLIESCEKYYTNKLSFREMIKLSSSSNAEEQMSQLLQVFEASKSERKAIVWEGLVNSSYWLYNHTKFLKAVSSKSFELGVIKKLLSLQKFDTVLYLWNSPTLKKTINNEEFVEALLSQYKRFFSQATNINDKIGSLLAANECLLLMKSLPHASPNQKEEISNISHLMKAISTLKNFKIYLESGVPLTPLMIVECKDPLLIISKILELNPKSYLAYEKLSILAAELSIGLNQSSLLDSQEPRIFDKIRAQCIESSLMDGNFQYAFLNSQELISKEIRSPGLCQLWLTFFQVGKYVSPEWEAEETPTEILMQQQDLLSQTLSFCPPSATKIILSRWKDINSKLISSLKDQIDDNHGRKFNRSSNVDRSLESRFARAITSTANEVLSPNAANQAGQQLSNLFVSGLGWAIGATPSK